MRDADIFTRDEIRAILIASHRENQALWSKWLGRTSEGSERLLLYRYREGFDAAILTLAHHFGVQLHEDRHPSPEGKKPAKATIISLEKPPISADARGVICPRCEEPLFRTGEKTWHCPACEVNFFLLEED